MINVDMIMKNEGFYPNDKHLLLPSKNEITGDPKVSGQNIRSYFDRLWESAKALEHWVRIRIFVGLID